MSKRNRNKNLICIRKTKKIHSKKKDRERRFSGAASLWRALQTLAALCRMVASKRVMHKPKKAKNDELERTAAAARKISIAWKHANSAIGSYTAFLQVYL